jgi:hypothetical protein
MGLILAALFVTAIPTSVWLVNFSRTAFDADTYIETFAERDVYEKLIPHVLPALAENPENQEFGQLNFQNVVENLEQDDWDAIAQEVVPAPYIQSEIERNLTIYDDYVDGERSRLEIVFETGILRDNLLGQPGDRMINRIVSSWDDCDAQGEGQIRAFLDNDSLDFPYCKPNDPALQREVFTLLNNAKDELASEIPEQWDLRQEIASDENLTMQEVDEQLYEAIQRPSALTRELTALWFLIPAMFLAMIVIFAVSSARGFFRWVGIPLTCGGIAALLPLGFVPFIISNAGSNNADANSIVLETTRGVVLSLVSDFTTPVLIQGALLVTVGFLFVFISMLLPDPHKFIPQPVIASDSSGGSTPTLQPESEVTPQTQTSSTLRLTGEEGVNDPDMTVTPSDDSEPS